MRVTVVGLGNMGRAFALRSLERGHDVTVWNRSGGKAAELAAAGANVAGSPGAAVAGAEVALVVLTDDEAVSSLCLGQGGVLDQLGSGGVMATVSPRLARRLAEEGPDGRVLDTPVLGAPAAISGGQGRFLVGGPETALSTIQPVLDDLGTSTVHCGQAGAGAVMKLVCNLLLVTGVAAMAEGVVIARGHGIDDALLSQVFADSPVVSAASRARLDAVLDPQHPGWFGPALALKDVRLAGDLAREAGAAVQLATAAEALLSEVVGAGREWPDFAAVVEAVGGPGRGRPGSS